MFHKELLANKTQLITVPLPGTAAMTILVLYPVGSRYESADLNGVSHFIEHLLFKGTVKHPRPIDISRALDSLGAEYNAFTGKDNTGYYVKASGEKLQDAAELVHDMLYNSLFAEAELEREKGVVIEEINMYKDNPAAMVEEYFEELMFPHHPLGKYIGGTEEIIRAMTREKIIAYRNRFYAPQNAVVVIAGSINKKSLAKVKSLFGSTMPAKKFKKITYEKCAKPSTRAPEERLTIKWKETDQAHIVLGFPALKLGDVQMPVLTVLSAIAGGSMSSRLFDVVREQKGLAYMIHAGTSPYQDVGTFIVQAGLNKTRTAEAIQAIKDELLRLKKELVMSDELIRTKDYVIGKTILQMEESSFWASWYARQAVLLHKEETPEQKLKRIRNVKAKEIQNLANRVFDFSAMHMALVGPYKDTKPFLKFL